MTGAARPRISVFPKCYFDALYRGEMDYLAWIRSAPALGGEGLEHYDGFFRSYDETDVYPVLDAMAATGQVSSMLCFSPDFTHPEAVERRRQVERQQAAIDLAVRLGTRFCRTLSGQRRPGLSRSRFGHGFSPRLKRFDCAIPGYVRWHEACIYRR